MNTLPLSAALVTVGIAITHSWVVFAIIATLCLLTLG